MDAFTAGLGKIANQYAPPNGWGRNPNVAGRPYNPDKAKQLLAEAGYPNGFRTQIITPQMTFYVLPATAIQNYLAKIGIVVELDIMGPARYQQLIRGAGWQDALLVDMGLLNEPDTAANLMTYLSSQSPVKVGMLCPDDYENALTKALSAGDFETKKKWTWEAQRLLVDKYALVNFFFTQPRITFFYNKVKDTGIDVGVDWQWTPADAWIER